MLPFGVTISATVPQGSKIPERLMNNPVYGTQLLRPYVRYCLGCDLLSFVVYLMMIFHLCNRPDVAQRVPGGLGSQISMTSALECGEVVSLTHRSPLPPGNIPSTHFH
jgi:hypothetical protein